MTLHTAVIAAAALALALPGAALAKEHGNQGHAKHSAKVHGTHSGSGKKAHAPSRAKACPPGLAKKNPGCLPPGQWRKGDRLPGSWVAHYVRYSALPDFYRNSYPVNPGYRYVYQDNRVIVVNAVTQVIVNIFAR